MFLIVPLGVAAVEVLVFVEVARAIGWLLALVLLLATSVLGARQLRVQGSLAVERVSLAISTRRLPTAVAIDGALGFLGAVLLVVPGFVTDALGALLLFGPTRGLVRRRISQRYERRLVSFVARTGRFTSSDRARRPADVDSTAVEDDLDQLDR